MRLLVIVVVSAMLRFALSTTPLLYRRDGTGLPSSFLVETLLWFCAPAVLSALYLGLRAPRFAWLAGTLASGAVFGIASARRSYLWNVDEIGRHDASEGAIYVFVTIVLGALVVLGMLAASYAALRACASSIRGRERPG